MGAADDGTTRLDASDIENGEAIQFDNTTGRPVSLRDTGSSMVQTVPDGVCRTLALDDGSIPAILVHPRLNAVTFVYDQSTPDDDTRP